MDPIIRRLYQLLIFGGIAIVLFILAFANPFIYDTTDFAITNTGWNGCSTIAIRIVQEGKLQPTFYFEDQELTLSHRSFTEYNLPPATSTLVVIGPRTPFSTEEVAFIDSFLHGGGMVLLADDFGTGHQLLTALNTSTRLSTKLVLDLAFEKQAPFVNVFTFDDKDSLLLSNVSHLLLNYPSRIIPGANTSVLAETTMLSWVDDNTNGKHDTKERKGVFPIIALEQIGQGTLVIVSDPSFFINSMKEYLDNQQFRDNLFHFIYDERSLVLIDESHRDVNAPLQLLYRLPQTLSMELKIGIVIMVLLIFLVVFTSIPRQITQHILALVRRPPQVERTPLEQQIQDLIEHHPDWDKKKLEKLLGRLKK